MIVSLPLRKQVRIKLSGGLGNQLFKILGGLEFCRQRDANPVLDLSWYYARLPVNVTQRCIAFTYFPHLRPLQTRSTLPTLRIYGDMLVARSGSPVRRRMGYYREGDDKLANVRTLDVRFEEVACLPDPQVIRTLLEFPPASSLWLEGMIKRLREQTAVAIHVRMGDYLKFPEVYDVLGTRYYERAISKVRERVSQRPIWLFSDDVASAMTLLGGAVDIDTVVEPPTGTHPGEVMQLLSSARFIITAHSTFSWWAAYLGYLSGNTEFVVIPQRYTAMSSTDKNPLAIASSNWEQV